MNSFLSDLSQINTFFHSLVNDFYTASFSNTKFKYILFTVIFITVMPFVIDIIFSFVLSVRSKRFVMFHSLILSSRDFKRFELRESKRFSVYNPVRYSKFNNHTLEHRRFYLNKFSLFSSNKFSTFLLNKFGLKTTNHMNIGSPRVFLPISHKPFTAAGYRTYSLTKFNDYNSKYVGARFTGLTKLSYEIKRKHQG